MGAWVANYFSTEGERNQSDTIKLYLRDAHGRLYLTSKAWNNGDKMVYYFTSNVVTPSAKIYAGKDKVESMFAFPISQKIFMLIILDEDLIKYGLEEDVWFHADKLSSAHIYLRMKEGESWESINEEVLIDCAQLTKANSIEGVCVLSSKMRHVLLMKMAGNKKDNVTIIYTPWSNLKKDGSMAVGQVSFKNPKMVRTASCIKIPKMLKS